jgi:uncharacterized protein YoxC
MLPAAVSATDVAYYALSAFLVLVGVGLVYALVRLGEALARLASLLRGVEKEAVPVIAKAGGSIDRVNTQLDKLDIVTDSAVDAVESVDTALRAVTLVVKTPIKKIAAWSAGIAHAVAAFRTEPDFARAAEAGRAMAAEREQAFDEEINARPGRADTDREE